MYSRTITRIFVLLFCSFALVSCGSSANEILDELNLSPEAVEYLRSRIKAALSELTESESAPNDSGPQPLDESIWQHQSYPSQSQSSGGPSNLLAAILSGDKAEDKVQRAYPAFLSSKRAYPAFNRRAYPSFLGTKRAYPAFNKRDGGELVKQLQQLTERSNQPAAVDQSGPEPRDDLQNPALQQPDDDSHTADGETEDTTSTEKQTQALAAVSRHLTAAMVRAKTNGISVQDLMKYFKEHIKGNDDSPVKRDNKSEQPSM